MRSYLRELEIRSSNPLVTPRPITALCQLPPHDQESPDESNSPDHVAPRRPQVAEPRNVISQDHRTSWSAAPSSRPPRTIGARQPASEIVDQEPTPEDSVGSPFRQNPLADNDYTFVKMGGRFWYMGPSSSWSFCRRVLALLGQRLPESSYVPDPGHFDGGVFRLRWRPVAYDEIPDVSNLPPLDYAMFLFSTAKFYLGSLAYVLDDEDFLRHLHEFYEDPIGKASSERHWFAQYLLILAFGKAFIVNQTSPEGPAGYQYATRAMALMPDLAGLASNAVHAVQALVLGAVYLQSIDMRVGALQHIGHALRICIVEGWHRHMLEEVVGLEHSRLCNTIFWVVYQLDRDFGSLIGAPSSIHDEAITAKAPSELNSSLQALNMTLHVRLSRLMARILTAIYGVGKQFDGSLVTNTQEVLKDLAQLSKDINALLDEHFQGSIGRASRMALRLILSYHHCVVLTTRPLVMCALHMHIKQTDTLGLGPISLSLPVASLLRSCVESAQSVLRILRVIGDEDLLEAFLPFQLEDAYSSAFVLYLIRVISPSLLQDQHWAESVQCIMDKMISKGSVVAPLRKLELSQLEHIMAAFTPLNDEPTSPAASTNNQLPNLEQIPVPPALTVSEPGWDLFMANSMIGISPGEMLDLAAQLELDGSFLPA
ncbi:Proline utilization trans-activator [Tolypocladium paradoxum]|uniref:Proline utilization trans-activator n=1 Tax=Tolypocladium paradoxum TaxID=94208 RepID=A0A2S4KS39_9HYPO|nr:Proline utilization trans-activator [Tolypocladium paradoxum]